MGLGYYYLGDMSKANIFHCLNKEGYSIANPKNYAIYESIKYEISIELQNIESKYVKRLPLKNNHITYFATNAIIREVNVIIDK